MGEDKLFYRCRLLHSFDVKSWFGLVSSSLLSNGHDVTDPQPKSQLYFTIDNLTNADEL